MPFCDERPKSESSISIDVVVQKPLEANPNSFTELQQTLLSPTNAHLWWLTDAQKTGLVKVSFVPMKDNMADVGPRMSLVKRWIDVPLTSGRSSHRLNHIRNRWGPGLVEPPGESWPMLRVSQIGVGNLELWSEDGGHSI